jgi:hypothetical protein
MRRPKLKERMLERSPKKSYDIVHIMVTFTTSLH